MFAPSCVIALAALAAVSLAAPLDDCRDEYSASMVSAGGEFDGRCIALRTFESCAAGLTGADSFIQEYQANNPDCAGYSLTTSATVSSNDDGLIFNVGDGQDVKFSRVRREVVSIFDLNTQVQTLAQQQGDLEDALVDTIDNKLNATAESLDARVAAATDALTSIVDAANLAQYATTTSVTASLDAARTQSDDSYATKTALTDAINSLTGRVTTLESSDVTDAAFSALAGRVTTLENAPAPDINVVAKMVDEACTAANIGTIRFNSGSFEFCRTAGSWSPLPHAGNLGMAPGTPASSCLEILQADSSATDGIYYLQASSRLILPVFCSMTRGGWALVAKASNNDGKNFYGTGNNSPFQTGTLVGTEFNLDLTRGDAVFKSYQHTTANKVMVYDELNDHSVAGSVPGTPNKSLFRLISEASGTVAGPVNCAVDLTNIQKSGNTVADVTTLGLGLKCEDDGQTSWRCDDDATYISWGLSEGSVHHTGGINKCGSDGGDDVYNGANKHTDAYVTVWVQ
eukprot:m.17125 g.17125  ORF g.17125 m.17125 type:complete len:515 (-) comp5399_c0_seq1:281-1825(-)